MDGGADTGAMMVDTGPPVGDDTGPPVGEDTGPPVLVDAGPLPDGGRACVSDEGCSDGLACNGTEYCGPSGFCQVTPHPGCDDGVECTDDRCAEPSGACNYVANDANCSGEMVCDLETRACVEPPPCIDNADCDDGVFCNGAEICMPEVGCMNQAPPSCDDRVDCTQDSCDPETDRCTHTAVHASCDDGEFCNGMERCDVSGGCLDGMVPCNDGVTCTMDMCNEATDSCVNMPVNAMCDDGLFCNGAETCSATGCNNGTAPDCGDGISCTSDSCSESLAMCVNAPADNDDDGHIAAGCMGGDDCDDTRATVHPGLSETCDGLDNDCVGGPDDTFPCVRGSSPTSCMTSCGTTGTRACNNNCTLGSCAAAAETCGNACDDDADTRIDEGCGGPTPSNDLCGGARVLSGAGTRTDTLVAATGQAVGCGSGNVEVFYRVNLSARSVVYLDTVDSALDTRISYLGGSCPGTTQQCEDNACGGNGAQLARVLDSGTHYFAVHTANSSVTPGAFDLRWAVVQASLSDNTRITTNGNYNGSLSSGQSNTLVPSCRGASASFPESGPDDLLWWTQCPGESHSVSATTCNTQTQFDTVLHGWTNASEAACVDDDGETACDLGTTSDQQRSTIMMSTSGAGVYRIFVMAWRPGSLDTGTNYRVTVSGL